MSASSVTGIGQGGVGAQKGSQRAALDGQKLIGPRLIDCGSVVLNGASPSVGTVPFSQTLSSSNGYFVMTTPIGSTTGGAVDTCVSIVATTGFVVTGLNASTSTINWALFFTPDPSTVH